MPEGDHNSYIFDGDRMIGKFEEMYAAVDDPWHQETLASSAEPVALSYIKELPDINDAIDIGCGTGRFTAEVASVTDAKVTGFDISETAIERAQAKYGQSASFVASSVPPLPLSTQSIDLVICSQIFWYVLPELQSVFSEISRVLRPNGSLVVIQQFYQPDQQKFGTEIMTDPDDLKRMMPFQVISEESVEIKENHKWVCVAQLSNEN